MSARVSLRHKINYAFFFSIQMCIHQGVFPSSALVSAPFNAGVIPQTVCIPHSWLCVMNNVFFFKPCRVHGDSQRNPHCIRSSGTSCDLSSSLNDLSACYTADVLSEPPLGVTSDLIEFPYTSSPKFCPYTDSRSFYFSMSCYTLC